MDPAVFITVSAFTYVVVAGLFTICVYAGGARGAIVGTVMVLVCALSMYSGAVLELALGYTILVAAVLVPVVYLLWEAIMDGVNTFRNRR